MEFSFVAKRGFADVLQAHDRSIHVKKILDVMTNEIRLIEKIDERRKENTELQAKMK